MAALTIVSAFAASPAGAVTCKPARYQLLGRVLDAGGAPLADASVRLVLDEVSAERFAEEGPRARLTRTGSSGAYLALIDCETTGAPSDAPSPCAAKPRHLTVSAEAPGHRGRVVVYKLKELEIISD